MDWKLKLDPHNAVPVYQQIVRQCKLLILQNKLADGDEIPSRRVLAALLGVNPNTMQRAFSEMESEGLIITPPNAKSIVRVNDETIARLNAELLVGQISELLATARGMGLDYKRLIDLISVEWDSHV